MTRNFVVLVLCIFSMCSNSYCKELFVSTNGDDANNGDISTPLKTINAAAQIAFPGDTITVMSGVYREWVNPPRGGNSSLFPILYRAAPNQKVEIKGSEELKGWKHHKGDVWVTTVQDSFFKEVNTLRQKVNGDWFYSLGGVHHTADIYLNGVSLFEAQEMKGVETPEYAPLTKLKEESLLTWFVEHKDSECVVYANFGGVDPNNELIEISVRPTCFYPLQQGINYITINGFDISQAATQWGAPTAEQIGMVAPHWGKGWIIEYNTIHDTKCSGITLGKEHSSGDNVWLKNQQKDGSLHYIETIFKAIDRGWDREHVGSHIIRYNELYNCEQTAICGSMGCAFSRVYNNYIHDIWVKRAFNGAEIAGIKFHGPIESVISNNYIHNAGRGIWLDWMTQGTRVSSNILSENDVDDLFVEVNHGPYIVDNNIFLSKNSLRNQSQGGVYIHNLFTGGMTIWPEPHRYTPYHLAHSTKVKGLSVILGGDDHYYNNQFIITSEEEKVRYGLDLYDKASQPTPIENNLYANGAKPCVKDENSLVVETRAEVIVKEIDGKLYLKIELPKEIEKTIVPIVNSSNLGATLVSEESFCDSNGESILFDKDILGNCRKDNKNIVGPILTINKEVEIWDFAKMKLQDNNR